MVAGLYRLSPSLLAECSQLALERRDLPVQPAAVARALELAPALEHAFGDPQAGLAELALLGKRALGVEAEVALKVRPAELATGGVEVVIGPPAIGGDDRLGGAEQFLGLLAVAGGGDPERSRGVGEGAPERPLLARLLPAGLIDVDDRGAANRIGEPLVGLAQGATLALNDRIDRADGDLGAEQLAAQVDHLAAREPKAGGEGGDGPLQARAEALAGDI